MIGLDPDLLLAVDHEGRPWRLVDGDRTFRWGLNGHVLAIERVPGRGRTYHWVESDEAVALWKRTRDRLSLLLESAISGDLPGLEQIAGPDGAHSPPPGLFTTLRKLAGRDSDALMADAKRFSQIYSPVGILPPDQYMALVVQLTHGCQFNTCTFCTLYRDTPFSVRTGEDLHEHLAAVDSFLGEGVDLRRSIFLGDANALVLPMNRLVPLIDIVMARYQGRQPAMGGMHAFLDGFSGAKKSVEEYRLLVEKGLRRTCIGMESGHDPLLHWLNKPGSSSDVVQTVEAMKVAGMGVSLVILLGAGGREYDEAHVRDTIRVLRDLPLDSGDMVYFSRYVDLPGAAYGVIARQEGISALDEAGMEEQYQAIASTLRAYRDGGPRRGRYDIREFIY
ncbi:radical SAM protein [Gemmatimonadota bacterium]